MLMGVLPVEPRGQEKEVSLTNGVKGPGREQGGTELP